MTVRNSQAQKKSQTRPLQDFLIDWNPPTPLDEEDVPANGQGP